ncbi:MAG: o-succinylbenzoate--CoA ligase [Ardenticatenales bacterium]|nr:o-succinylbenzoate--CoA ligase [Ardenticatenales bacterium]
MSLKRDWLAERAAVSPGQVGLQIDEQQWTYQELDGLTGRLARQLNRLGVQPGWPVAALMLNSLDYVLLVHAAARTGAILVPLNSRLTVPELEYQLEKSGARLLFCDDKLLPVASELAANHAVVNMGALPDPGVQLLADVPERELPLPAFDLNNVQAIVFTSGTTGRPKGVRLTFANHFWSANSSAYRLGLDINERWLSCLPFYHVGGLAVLFRSCLYGTVVVLHDRFDVARVSDSLDRDGITLVSLVPTMVYRLLEHRGERPWPATLRHLLLGGAAAPADLVARCQALGIPVTTTYGMTEASSQIATLRPEQVPAKPHSVGKPLLFTRVRIVDEQGKDQPAGLYGEILVSGPTVMAGYHDDPDATARTLRDGWLYTGDIGYLDEDGDLVVIQRRHDVIISGGENVYPAEVEAVLRQHPAVAAAAVAGVADQEWGQRVVALVVPNSPIEPAELLEFSRAQLAGYKQPRQIFFVSELPLTANGKIARQAVREQLAALVENDG